MARESGGGRKGLCPKCQGRLHQRALGGSGVKVDSCPSCHGIWFDGGELQKHSAAVTGDIVPSADAEMSGRYCPRCEVVMTSFRYSGSGVTIDLCEECRGVWLDMGEFKRLAGEPTAERDGGLLGLLGRTLKGLTPW